MDMNVIIESVVLLEINYTYELELVKLQNQESSKDIHGKNNKSNNNVESLTNSDNFSQYHILMGSKEDNQIHIIKSVYVSNHVRDKMALSISTREKVELLQVVKHHDEEIEPLAIFITNPSIDYNSDLVGILLNEFQIKYKFEYELNKGGATEISQKNIDKELHLKCYCWDQKWYRTGFEINDRNIDLTPAPIDMDEHGNNILGSNPRYTRFDRDIDLTDPEVFDEESKEQNEFIKRLINRIDQIIDYLEQSQSPSEEILIKVNLLILRLQNVNTEDIDTELASIENEIEILQTICNQWEIIN